MIACLLTLSLIAQAPASNTRVPQTNTIVEVSIEGNRVLNREGIRSTTGLRVDDLFSNDAIEQAKKNLISTGLYGAECLDKPEEAVRIKTRQLPSGVAVTIEVRENPVVKDFNISGSGPIKTAELIKVIQTKPGQILNLNTIRADISAIQKLYAGRGYRASIQGERFGIDSKGTLDLPILVAVVGKIKINGLPTDLAAKVRGLLRLQPGSFFHLPTFDGDVKRINGLLAPYGYHVPDFGEIPVDNPALSWSTDGFDLSLRDERTLNYTIKASPEPSRKIAEIAVRGTDHKALIIKVSGLRVGDLISASDLESAKKRITGAEDNRYDATTWADGLSLRMDSVPGGVRVTIEFEDDPMLTSFEIVGSGPIKTADVLSALKLRVGSTVSVSQLRDGISRLQQLYEKRGYVAFIGDEKTKVTNGILHVGIDVARVKSVEAVGAPPDLAQAIYAAMKTRPGTHLHKPTFLKDLNAVRQICNSGGYEFARSYPPQIPVRIQTIGEARVDWEPEGAVIRFGIAKKGEHWRTHITVGHVF